jgi:IS5 family transposase
MLVVRRLYDWSFEATERNVSDSLVLRQFTRLYLEPAPDDTTLIRWGEPHRPSDARAPKRAGGRLGLPAQADAG